MIILGCDPGLDGAIAVYRKVSDGWTIQTHDMPTLKVKARSNRRVMDDYELARLVDVICRDGAPNVAVVEHVGPGQQKGTVASFQLGANFGVLRGVLAGAFIPIHMVQPGVWKRQIGIAAGADKDASRLAASRLLPTYSGQWSRVKDHGRAEAALLALYGWRFVVNVKEAA
jgi:hypothetical protein